LINGFDDVQTTHQALAAFGLKSDVAASPQHQDIYPDNLEAFNVFYRIKTQWNVGMNGPVGLRMEAMPLALEIEGIPRHRWPEVVTGVQVMESETLRILRERR
jgi:hypothetical protein